MLILLDAEPFEAVIRGTVFLIKPLDVEERRTTYRECQQAGQLGATVQPDDATFGRAVFEKAVKGWGMDTRKWWMLKGGVKTEFEFTPENFQLALKKIDQAGLVEIMTAACSSAQFLEAQAELQGKS